MRYLLTIRPLGGGAPIESHDCCSVEAAKTRARIRTRGIFRAHPKGAECWIESKNRRFKSTLSPDNPSTWRRMRWRDVPMEVYPQGGSS